MFRINEAIARAQRLYGRTVLKKDIAARLWPDTTEVAQMVNMTRLCSGKTTRIEPGWVAIVAEMTGCTANYLLGISND